MQPLDGSESLVIDCSVTMAWYFKDEAGLVLEIPGHRDRAIDDQGFGAVE